MFYNNKVFKYLISLAFFLFSFCSESEAEIPMYFNNCEVSIDSALDELRSIESEFEISLNIRIVRELTDRDECIDQVLGTNLPQGASLENGTLIDLVVGIKKNEVTDFVKKTELDLYLDQLDEKDLLDINLISDKLSG